MTITKNVSLTGGAAVLGCLGVLAFAFGVTAFEAWILTLIAGCFDWHPGFWLAFVIVFFANMIFGGSSRRG